MAGNRAHDLAAVAGPALVATGCAALLAAVEPRWFRTFFGDVPALLVVLTCVLLVADLAVRLPRYGFAMYRAGRTRRGLAAAAGVASAFGAVIVVVDLVARFPADINVPLPQALAFYPAMGFVADVALHLLPLAVLSVLLLRRRRDADPLDDAGGGRDRRARLAWWSCVVLASIPEAVLQFAAGQAGGSATGLNAVVAVHLMLFGVAQLLLLRRYGYLAMFGMRMVYYVWWHLAWGTLRLQVLVV